MRTLIQIVQATIASVCVTTISGCANQDVIHASAKDLQPSATAKIVADRSVESRASPAIVRVKDMNKNDVVPFSLQYKESVVLAPGTFEVQVLCLLGNNMSATPSITIEAQAGYTYLLHCQLDGARVAIRARRERSASQ